MINLTDKTKEKVIAEKRKAVFLENQVFFPKCVLDKRAKIVIAGFGPAGMFAALTLAKMGYKPLVLERGKSMEERVNAVENSIRNRMFSLERAVQERFLMASLQQESKILFAK